MTALQVNAGLIHEAQLGYKGSMDRLAELAKERLYAYIFRLTLDENLTEDILQETILFMIQSIDKLERPDQFWQWLFRTAMGKVQHHYRELKRKRTEELSDDERLKIHHRVSIDLNDGLTELLRKELSDAVFTAMRRLNIKYRNILVLRCLENLEFAEIAQITNSSEIGSRVLFFRAKNSLRRKMAGQGFGKRHLLLAIALFGLVTTSAKAASSTTVTVASLEAGFLASLIAAFTSKIGLAAAACATAVALTVPAHTLLYLIPLVCFIGFCIFFICLFGIYGS
jgi:RNA polymerase sigma-70 factor (ECF subfamily)